MNPDFEKIIIESAQEVFSAMVFIDIQPCAAEVSKEYEVASDLTSLIGLAGDMRGLLGIHCSENAAKSITGGMLGMDVEEMDDDVKDAIGEIANMVAGGIKDHLIGDNVKVQLAIPTTTIGKSLRTSGIPGGARIVIPFTLPEGSFNIELKYVLS